MRVIDGPTTAQLLPYPALIDALHDAFSKGDGAATAPPRLHYSVPEPADHQHLPQADRTLLIMPSWANDAGVVVKLVNVVPSNSARSLAAIQAQVLVADAETGAWSTLIDGATLTARRTAAASALAARYLAPTDAKTLLIVGTGRLSLELAHAHMSVRPSINKVLIWGRDQIKAAAVASQLDNAQAVNDLAQACGQADVISCCTLSNKALVKGAWVKPNTHIDLVGAYRSDLRETDSELVAKSLVFVDTYAGAHGEAGDLLQAAQEGYFDMANIQGDLHQLSGMTYKRLDQSITLFKSVGASIEDFVAARMVAEASI
jgi:ornithine cyclodeaminase|tara:strand:- start:2936 stop:3886 length:951 start_codon:yes stop_codon:yes gene_type:complete